MLDALPKSGGQGRLKRVLVLGGYGTFGARICELLVRHPDFSVLVAGRSLEKATEYCGRHPDPRLTPVRVDRDHSLQEKLEEIRPWLVVDAAGPFQGATYKVAKGCIAAGCNYLDIADGRDFVEEFSFLDGDAKAAGVTLISGASSVPSLSSAVVTQLSAGLDRLGLVESAITASNRATVGRSVLEAILSYVGRPVALRQGGQTLQAHGWRDLRRMTFATSRSRPLIGRWVGICDVPDLGVMSDQLPGRPLVLFRAGAELALHNLSLWLFGWVVQWGLLRSLLPLAGALQLLRGLTSRLGGERSAMLVSVVGQSGGDTVERRWTLIADHGRGPYTPCLAAPLLAKRLADGQLPHGAYTAAGLLPLEAFEPDFAGLGFDTETVEVRSSAPLYARILGDAFDRLPFAIRELHHPAGALLAEGRARVTRGTSLAARVIALMMRFPPAALDVPVRVRFFEWGGPETWIRTFGSSSFTSKLSERDGLLIERFGPLQFGFALNGDASGLSMDFRRWWLGPLPMPRALGPRTKARETVSDGIFHFDVAISMPMVGPIIRYEGSLAVK
ncbi:DUF4166 domain-containing protein [Phenylobacterium sp.]|uniref:DUF4166 domain-containing protein n=1 Tax=Phenylobacterium sp. TaxID=1871053 RepID=UPI003001FE2B